MTLHMLMSSAPHWPEHLAPLLGPGDALLLVGDGVYLLPFFSQQANLFVRQRDLEQRGLSLSLPATSLDDAEWVTLTLSHQPVVSWS